MPKPSNSKTRRERKGEETHGTSPWGRPCPITVKRGDRRTEKKNLQTQIWLGGKDANSKTTATKLGVTLSFEV